MKRPFDLDAGKLAELVSEVLRVTREDDLIIQFASRTVALVKFPKTDANTQRQREELIPLLIEGAETLMETDPELSALVEAGRIRKSPPRKVKFVDPRKDPYDTATEASSSSFENYSLV